MCKGFSLVELLVTCSLVALLVAVAVGMYNGLNQSAIDVAQKKDQAELQQVLQIFRLSGGNVAAISNSGGDAATQAMAFNILLHGSPSSNSRTQKGTVGNSLPQNENLVPYPYTSGTSGLTYGSLTDGKPRLVFDPTTAAPSLVTAVADDRNAFVVVNNTSSLGQAFHQDTGSPKGQNDYRAAMRLVNNPVTGAIYSNLNGSKYASRNAYIWDEDTTVVGGPVTPVTSVGVPVQTTNLIGINFAFAYANEGDIVKGGPIPFGSMTYQDYTSPILGKVYVFAFRHDGTALSATDIALLATYPYGLANATALSTSGAATISSAGEITGLVQGASSATPGAPLHFVKDDGSPYSNNSSVSGFLIQVFPNGILTPNAWPAGAPELYAVANSNNPIILSGSDHITITAVAASLKNPVTSGSGSSTLNLAHNASAISGTEQIVATQFADSTGNAIAVSADGSFVDAADGIRGTVTSDGTYQITGNNGCTLSFQ